MTENPQATAYVLYCLAPAGSRLRLPDAGVFQCDANDISAILSEVPCEEYCGPAAEARLRDLAWLGPRACRHEAVVEHVMQQSPVLPAPFATPFTSQDRVLRFLADHHAAITGFFEELGDRREWAVKGLWDWSGDLGETAPSAASGKEYLLAKRSQDEARRARSRQVRQACREAMQELEQQAAAFCERRVWNLPGEDAGAVIVNWAFLLSPAQEPCFRARVEDINLRRRLEKVSFLLSGPWPPYSFAPVLGEAPP